MIKEEENTKSTLWENHSTLGESIEVINLGMQWSGQLKVEARNFPWYPQTHGLGGTLPWHLQIHGQGRKLPSLSQIHSLRSNPPLHAEFPGHNETIPSPLQILSHPKQILLPPQIPSHPCNIPLPTKIHGHDDLFLLHDEIHGQGRKPLTPPNPWPRSILSFECSNPQKSSASSSLAGQDPRPLGEGQQFVYHLVETSIRPEISKIRHEIRTENIISQVKISHFQI